MAAINHITTLGIGTPGAILQFLTFGLGIGSGLASTPLCLEQFDSFHAGADAAEVFHAGATTAESFHAGADKGDTC